MKKIAKVFIICLSITVLFIAGYSSPGNTQTKVSFSLPGIPSSPSPSNGAQDISIGPTLTWVGSADTKSYDVYFGTSSGKTTYVGNTTNTSYSLVGLSSGTTYYWKIAAKNSAGNSTTGSVWSFTTADQISAKSGAPTSPSPSNGATGISNTTTLSWVGSVDTKSYDVYFGTSSGKTTYKGNTTNTGYPLSGLSSGTTYYWKIVAKKSSGNSTAGSVWCFTTAAQNIEKPGAPTSPSPSTGATGISTNPTPGKPGTPTSPSPSTGATGISTSQTPGKPGIPSNSSPSNGATGISTSITLIWEAAADTKSYDVYLGTSSGKTNYEGNTANTSYTLSGLNYSTTYYWKIIATGSSGSFTTGSIWSFTTGAQPCEKPDTPSNSSPLNGASEISTNPTLRWATAADAKSYDVYLGISSDTINYKGNTTSTSFPLSNLNYSTTYYWKIAAKNSCGKSIPKSVWSFTTAAQPCDKPGTPSNPSPLTGATVISTNPTLSWAAAADAKSYDVYLGTSSDKVTYKVNTTSTSCLLSGLNYGSTYYWKIVAKNSCGNATTGPVWSFITGPCNMPKITSQPQNQTIQSGQTAALLVSASGTTPLTYQWYQGSAGDTSNPVGSNSSSYTTPALTNATSYWVTVANGCGSANSKIATIMVPKEAPVAPRNVFTSKGTSMHEIQVTWTAAQWATSYTVYRSASLSDAKTALGTTSDTNYIDKTAMLGQTYYYWVKASNVYGTSAFSVSAKWSR